MRSPALAVASLLDLALMKLGALISRGTRRDFVDLWCIDRELPLAAVLGRAGDKFGHVGDFPLQAAKALADFSEAEDEPMPRLAAGHGLEGDPRLGDGGGGEHRAGGARRVSDDLLITRLAELATPEGAASLAGSRAAPRPPRARRRGSGARRADRLRRSARGARAPLRPARPVWRGSTATAAPPSPASSIRTPISPGPARARTSSLERLAGRSYQEIAAEGGGILSTVRATRGAGREALVLSMLRRLDWMLACGTTTAEAKSGYGLSLADELKQLEAIRDAAARHPVELVPTLLAAHEVPPEHRADRAR